NGFYYRGAHRHTQDDILGRLGGALPAMASLTTASTKNRLMSIVHQRIQVSVCLNKDRTPGISVTTLRATIFYRLFPAIADAAIAAFAGVNFNDCFIYELHNALPPCCSMVLSDTKKPRQDYLTGLFTFFNQVSGNRFDSNELAVVRTLHFKLHSAGGGRED